MKRKKATSLGEKERKPRSVKILAPAPAPAKKCRFRPTPQHCLEATNPRAHDLKKKHSESQVVIFSHKSFILSLAERWLACIDRKGGSDHGFEGHAVTLNGDSVRIISVL